MTCPTPARLSVLQVVNTLAVSDGGPARHSLEVNAALNARDDARARLLWFRGAAHASHLADGVPAHVRTAERPSGPREVWQRVGASEVVVIHGIYLPWVPWVALACRIRGVPYVVMPHGVFTGYQRRQSRLKKAVFDLLGGRAARRGAASFVVATEDERGELAQAYPGIAAVAVGVGTAMPESPAAGERHEPLRLVTLSRIAPKKRIDVAIEAVALLRERGVEARLTVAGTGDPELMATLRAQVTEQDLEERVELAGEVRGGAKGPLLSGADVMLAPSEDENFGISIAEGLAHGLPVAATRFVGAALPADGVAGRVIAEVSAEQLADAVEELRATPDFARLRAGARAVAAEHYAWEAVGGRWHDALVAAAGATGRAVPAPAAAGGRG
ncbi:glycosyltransferase [Demequina iriomotensis]|uniref:glycosyltransferase n=1 Tax=Demequina iriomotensis TaxID=1536641 RepID=UPI000780EC06|nr:glycosyltransferase [Demequina iriomotensis]